MSTLESLFKSLVSFFVPVHRDGLKFLLPAVALSILFFLLWAPLGWLFAIVRRECLRFAARLTGHPVDLDEALADPANEARLVSMPQHELRIDVSRAIESLPSHYREIVLLRDVEELTIDEIAAALMLSREAVKGRLHRARALLREYLLK